MTDTVMYYIVKTILIILSLFLYVFLVSSVFPKIFLTPSYKAVKVRDRGVKKYIFEKGRAIVFEPAISIRKYITQYILSDNCGERFLKLKTDKHIASLRYDVVAFDANDRVIDTLEVCDHISNAGISKAVALPLKTAYIAISVRDVNGIHVTNDPTASFSYLKICAFVLLSSVSTVAMSLMFKFLLVYFADLLFAFTERYGEVGNTFAITSALILSAVYCAAVWLCHRDRDIRIK